MYNFFWGVGGGGASTAFREARGGPPDAARGSDRHAPATPPAEKAAERGSLRGASDQRPQEGYCLLAPVDAPRRLLLRLGFCSSRVCLRPSPAQTPKNTCPRTYTSLYALNLVWAWLDHVCRRGREDRDKLQTRPQARRRRETGTTKTLGIDVGEGVGRRAVSQAQARADSLYHFTSLAMPSLKGVWGS